MSGESEFSWGSGLTNPVESSPFEQHQEQLSAQNAQNRTRPMSKSILAYRADGRPIFGISGSEREGGGYNVEADIASTTLDGADLNAMYAEWQETIAIVNDQRSILTQHLAFGTTLSAEEVLQSIGESDFEQASEFGEPRGIRPLPAPLVVGYSFNDWDLATRYSWRFLRGASQAQLQAIHSQALFSDNKLTTTAILRRLLDPTTGMNSDGRNVYGLYCGDAQLPPRYGFNVFTEPHDHYLTSSSDLPDGADLDDMIKHIREHGYGTTPGSRLLLFCHPWDLGPLTAARAGDEFGSQYDFLPSSGAPAYLTDKEIVGDIAPAEYNRLKIAGSYGDVWITSHDFMPPGYMAMVASGGPNSDLNPIGFREHPNPAYRGLQLLPGNQQRYPLIDSYYVRGFGVGVRHRGAAVAMQITTAADYTPPSSYEI